MVFRPFKILSIACLTAITFPQNLFAHGNPVPPQNENAPSSPTPSSTTTVTNPTPFTGDNAGPSNPGVGGPGAGIPSTGSPGGPSTGGPGGPRTGSPAGTGTGGPGGPTTGGGGAPIEFRRGSTSLERLEIDWDYPVPEDGIKQALSFDEALAAVRGDDPRPLLIVRECLRCPGAASGLLDFARGNDERTRLLTHWYHCVRLPTNVWEKDHAFHELFRGMGVSHLFVTSWDGTEKLAFSGTQTRSTLWRGMDKILREDYARTPRAAVAKMRKHLDVYDMLDAKIEDAQEQFDRALENHGPKSSRFKKAQQRLQQDRAALARAEATEKKIVDLGLRRRTTADD